MPFTFSPGTQGTARAKFRVVLAPVALALVMSWASQHLSSLAALVHALEDDYPPDVATLAELSDLLAKAKTATSLF